MDPNSLVMQRLRTELYAQINQEFAVDNVRLDLASLIVELPTTRPKSSLPHPETFCGTGHKFNIWYAAMRAKLEAGGGGLLSRRPKLSVSED